MKNLIFPRTLVNLKKIIFLTKKTFRQITSHSCHLHSDTLFWFRANQYLLFLRNAACLTNTNFIVLGLTRLRLEPTIYRTRGEHANHYATDAVVFACSQRRTILSYCDKVYSRGNINQNHRIGGVMVCVLASSAVDRGFEPQSGQTKDYKIGIC
jgi:hypothetical protein